MPRFSVSIYGGVSASSPTFASPARQMQISLRLNF
jgi:hypothetical protein